MTNSPMTDLTSWTVRPAETGIRGPISRRMAIHWVAVSISSSGIPLRMAMFLSMEVPSLEEVEHLRELVIADVVEGMEIDTVVIRLA
jgi:hypothetical protein